MTKHAEAFKSFGFWLLVLLFTINIVGGFVFNLFDVWYFDIVLHFLGGFGVYLFAKQFFKQALKNASWFDSALLLTGATIFVGVFWEFGEYALSIIWQTRPEGLTFIGDLMDTMNDLLMDMLGAVMAAVTTLLHFFRHRKS